MSIYVLVILSIMALCWIIAIVENGSIIIGPILLLAATILAIVFQSMSL